MRMVTASEARRTWFHLLDEAAGGEVIVVQRKGRRLVLRREENDRGRSGPRIPSYRRLLRAPQGDAADRWSWEWRGPGRGAVLRRASRR